MPHNLTLIESRKDATITKYLSPTNHKGARIKATCGGDTITKYQICTNDEMCKHQGRTRNNLTECDFVVGDMAYCVHINYVLKPVVEEGTKTMNVLTISIEIGNDEMKTPQDVGGLLERLALRLGTYTSLAEAVEDYPNLKDVNGNNVGNIVID